MWSILVGLSFLEGILCEMIILSGILSFHEVGCIEMIILGSILSFQVIKLKILIIRRI